MAHVPSHVRLAVQADDPNRLRMRIGVVTAAAGNRVSVDIDGTTLANLPRLGSAGIPAVGARVLVLATPTQAIVAGVIA